MDPSGLSSYGISSEDKNNAGRRRSRPSAHEAVVGTGVGCYSASPGRAPELTYVVWPAVISLTTVCLRHATQIDTPIISALSCQVSDKTIRSLAVGEIQFARLVYTQANRQ